MHSNNITLVIRFMHWGGPTPHRTAEDVAFAVGRFFQYGGTFQNYYMVTNCIILFLKLNQIYKW